MRSLVKIKQELADTQSEFDGWRLPSLSNNPVASSERFRLHQQIARLLAELMNAERDES